MSDSFRDGEIKGVVIRKLAKANDPRGWLSELFRNDELEGEFFPTMAYISSTNPGVTRGPHEHRDQADLFCFIGPSNFKLRMWDNREGFGDVWLCDDGRRGPGESVVGACARGRGACVSKCRRDGRHRDQLSEPSLQRAGTKRGR